MAKFKKFLKKAVSVAANPFAAGSAAILGAGQSDGPTNPYAPPNVDYLRQPDAYISGLTDNYKNLTDPYFDRLVSTINAPSSVDEVTRRVENENFTRTMGQIGRDTKSGADSALAYFADRGLARPGQSSDITAEGVGVAFGKGSEAAAGARSQLYLSELARQQAREKALMDAYSTRYSDAAKTYPDLLGTQAKLKTSRDLGYGEIMADLYSDAEKRRQDGKKNPIYEDILRNSQISVSPKF